MKHFQDPRLTLGVLSLTAISVLFINTSIQIHLLMGLCALYLFSLNKFRVVVVYTLIYILLWGLIYIFPSRFGDVGVVIMVAVRMMPMMAIGTVFVSTPADAIMLAGHKIRLPQAIIIAICILLRFSSVIRQEMHRIDQGIRARGLLPHWYSVILHPARSYECFVLPLIIRGLRLSTELTCAAQLRGIENSLDRTCIYSIAVTAKDVIRTVFHGIACAAVLWFGRNL